MQTIRNIRLTNENNYIFTIGLKRYIGFECKLLTKQENYHYVGVLTYLIDYFIDHNPVINNNQTIAYHSWLLKFVIVGNEINLYQAHPEGNDFVEGVDYAIKVVTEQKEECDNYNAIPLFPLFSQMIVVSAGVLEGKDIDAVRYASPAHMTGWWLTTELYDDDIKSLKTIHYYHLAFKRPDIIRYLALPFGFRFLSGDQMDVWFDEKGLS